jgi:hypothetical protein
MRRWLITILIFLLAGAAVNVAVAWIVALRVVHPASKVAQGYSMGPEGSWNASKSVAFGTTWIGCYRENGKSDPHLTGTHPQHIVPSWPGLEVPSPEWKGGGLFSERRLLVARGWPLRSLWLEHGFHTKDGRVRYRPVSGAIDLSDSQLAKMLAPQPSVAHLPVRLIWSGSVINTLSFAAILWLLIVGPFVLRRFLRRRRGLCLACAYPRGESASCTECGKPLPKCAVA